MYVLIIYYFIQISDHLVFDTNTGGVHISKPQITEEKTCIQNTGGVHVAQSIEPSAGKRMLTLQAAKTQAETIFGLLTS